MKQERNVRDIVDRLNRQGFAVMEPMGMLEVDAVNLHLHSCNVFLDAHVPQTARNRRASAVPRSISGSSECVCVDTWDALRAPYVFERALELTADVGTYLGRDPPVCYSTNAFWTRPGPAALRGDIQDFHCDKDDERFLAMFVFLTDVIEDADGPQDLHGPDGTVHTIRGPAGTVFLADTSRLHRGRKPSSRERGLMWFRWGVSDRPPANVWDKIEPMPAADLGDRYPADERLRESVRLLVC